MRTTELTRKIDEAEKLLDRQQRIEAQEIFSSLLDESVTDAAIIGRIGGLAARLGEKIIAINYFAQLSSMSPDNVEYLNNYAQAFIENDMLPQAEEQLLKAIEKKPDYYLSYVKLAYVEMGKEQYQKVIEYAEKALELKPSEPAAYYSMVSAYILLHRIDDAFKVVNKLLRIKKGEAQDYYLLATILNNMGRFDEANFNINKAISMDRTYGAAYWEYATTNKFSSVDDTFIKQAVKALKLTMPAEQRAAICYSLGKAYNDCREWDRAFEYYRQGNLLAKPAIRKTKYREFYSKTRKLFNQKLFEQFSDQVSSSERPVFIVGMPRSGTTLIEQIIASHPQGGGAGELQAMEEIVYSVSPIEAPGDFKEKLQEVFKNKAQEGYIEYYLSKLENDDPDVIRVVDKMPHNFLYLGMINLLFPNAHIINAIRSPLDVCLSCYFQFFQSLEWSTDLEWIASEYRLYRQAMDHWKKALPEGKIIDIHYEQLISEPEAQARSLIEGIGLPWDAVCLDFHKRKSAVVTASLWQVRQPVYKTSSKRWLNYIDHLAGVASELQDYLSEDDLEEFSKRGIKLKKKWFRGLFN